MVGVFRKGKFELLALNEMKLKENGEVLWCVVNVFIGDVQEVERAREGVAILLNDMWHSAVIDFGCVSPRILWIKFKISRVKVCMVLRYGSNENDGQDSGYSR